MLISLFSFVPQTEPEVFTGQEGEHKNLFLANNCNHTVATFDISTYWEQTVHMKDSWKYKCQNCKAWDVFQEINNWNYISSFTIKAQADFFCNFFVFSHS